METILIKTGLFRAMIFLPLGFLMTMAQASRRYLIGFAALIVAGCGALETQAREESGLRVDEARGEIVLSGVVQHSKGPSAHDHWGKKSTAFVGVKGGSEEKSFAIVLDASREAIYRAAREDLGWRTGRRWNWKESTSRRGWSKKTRLEDFMTGDPVFCILEFEIAGKRRRIALEEAIRSRTKVEGTWVETPYTPHFVFTGAGEENNIDSGCLYCPSDCVGGLMTDNRGPVQTESQEFLIDWKKLPESGEPITVILRSIR